MDQNGGKRKYKLAVMGGGGVGKSCLTVRMLRNTYMETYDPTLEDFYTKENFMVDGEPNTLEILDTAGQDNVIGSRDHYYRSAEAFLFVYSVSDKYDFHYKLSVQDVIDRINGLKTSRGVEENSKLPPIIIVGNKCDLPDNESSVVGEIRQVTREEGQAAADKFGALFEESSAKANINVKKVFEDLVRELKRRDEIVKEPPVVKKKEKTCCTIV